MRDLITLPFSTKFGAFDMTSQTFDMDEVADVAGSVDTTIYGHPRWRVTMAAMDNISLEEAAFWKYVLMALKGRANRIAVWDPVNSQPRGTMRGAPTLATTAPAGATSIQISAGAGQASTTLYRGDMLQIGSGYGTSQLVMVMADVTLNGAGAGTVQIAHYLRQEYAAATTVIWDHPVVYCASVSTPTGWSYATNAPLVSTGFVFDLMEQWT